MVSTWEQLSDDSVLVSTMGLPDYIEPSEGSVRAYVCSSSCHIRPGYSPHKCLIPSESWKFDDDSSGLSGEAGG